MRVAREIWNLSLGSEGRMCLSVTMKKKHEQKNNQVSSTGFVSFSHFLMMSFNTVSWRKSNHWADDRISHVLSYNSLFSWRQSRSTTLVPWSWFRWENQFKNTCTQTFDSGTRLEECSPRGLFDIRYLPWQMSWSIDGRQFAGCLGNYISLPAVLTQTTKSTKSVTSTF